MGPRDPRRAVQDEIREVLADPALRGDRLAEALSNLGRRHAVDPFRSALASTLPIDCAETEARDTLRAIEGHRDALHALLGRDPGFAVAAFDLLHEGDRAPRDPVFRQGTGAGEAPPAGSEPGGAMSVEEALRAETRRAGRSGRSLAVVVLSGAEQGGAAPDSLEGGLAGLRDCARDIDFAGLLPSGDLVVLLPCTGGREGLRAAERFRRSLEASTGRSVCAGVAAAAGRAADARVLARRAAETLAEARRNGLGLALHRPERRAHARVAVGGGIPARLRRDGMETEVVLEDLSLGGALLVTGERIDPGGEVVLALRGSAARPVGCLIPSRVLRVMDGPTPGTAPWRAAVGFRPEARLPVAALLAGLAAPGGREGT